MADAPFTREQVLGLARLAHLHLEDEEVDRMVVDLRSIVGMVRVLSTADLGDDPEPEALTEARWRPDDPRPGMGHELAMASAADVQDRAFRVPPTREG